MATKAMAIAATTAGIEVRAAQDGVGDGPADGLAGPDGMGIPPDSPGTGRPNGAEAGMGDGTSLIGEQVRGPALTGSTARHIITGTTPHLTLAGSPARNTFL